MPTTISDIAQRLRISKSTVSKALNGYPDVSVATRERVQQVAKEMGYQPSAAAITLSRGRSEKFGLFLNASIDYVIDYLSAIIAGAVRQANRFDKHLVLYTITDNDPSYLLRICRSREIDGVILFSSHFNQHTIETLLEGGFPFVVMGRQVPDKRVSFVAPDYYDGVYQSTRHLIERGHRRIGLMTRPELATTNAEHVRGYTDALHAAGLDVDRALMVKSWIEPNAGVKPTEALLALPHPPTAILAFHDLLALDALRVIQSAGLRVPDDVALVGFDGLRVSALTTPAITTVQQPFEYIGRRVIDIVNAQTLDAARPPMRETVPVELVVRQSSG